MTTQWRRRLSSILRILVCVAAVGWLARDPNWKWKELKNVVASANWRLVLLAILAFGPAPVLISFRLKWLLAVHHVVLTTWQAIKVTFAGNFINFALPVGTSGGDAVKAFYIARDTAHKHEAITCVFFDRVIGVVGLVLMSGLMVLIDWHNPAFAGKGRTIGVFAVGLFVGTVVYYSRTLRGLLRLDNIVARLPLAAHIQRVDRAVLAFRHRPRRLAACLVLTAALQGVAIFSMFLAGWALGLVGDHPLKALFVYFAYVPICFLTGVLPIGVMEITFKELFSGAAHLGTPEAAVSLSLLGRLIQLVWALPGALVVLKGGSYRQADEIAALSETELSAPH